MSEDAGNNVRLRASVRRNGEEIEERSGDDEEEQEVGRRRSNRNANAANATSACNASHPNGEVHRERRTRHGRGCCGGALEPGSERRRNLQTWAVVVLVGLAISSVSYVMTLLMALLLEAKLALVALVLRPSSMSSSSTGGFGLVALASLAWTGLAFAMVCAAFALVTFVAPLGAGSGLPETKGFLNGTKVKGLFSLRTLFVRAAGVVLVVSATLPVGREQPLIHIGASVSYIVMHLPPVMRLIQQKDKAEDARERTERVYATIGAAAGISSAYGAPVGGVLYIFEELATFWDEKTTLKCFVACLLAAALVSWIKLGGFLGETFEGLVIFENGNNTLQLGDWSVAEVPLFVLLGLLGGLSASVFTWIALRVTHVRRSMRLRYGRWSQLADLVAVVVVINLLYFMLPASFGCDAKPEYAYEVRHRSMMRRHLFAGGGGDAGEGDHHRQFYSYNCPEGYYNKLASLLLTGEEGSLKHLFARDVDVFGPAVLVTFFFVYFLSAIGVVGLQVPMGHFVPNMLGGAALGRLFGKLMKTWFKGTGLDISPGIYAQIGSAAQLSGFTRMTIALAVLLTEASGDVSLMIPMMIAMLFARGLAGFLLLPMDEVLMEIKHIVFLGSKPPRSLESLTAREVMRTDFNVLDADCSIEDAADAVADTHNHQVRFPVLGRRSRDDGANNRPSPANSGGDGESGASHVESRGAGRRGRPREMIGVIARSSLRERLKHVQSENALALEEDDFIQHVDLTDGSVVMDRNPLTVSPDVPMPQVFDIFRKFGVRQMFVVGNADSERGASVRGAEGCVVGMLSRSDLVDPEHAQRANDAYGSSPTSAHCGGGGAGDWNDHHHTNAAESDRCMAGDAGGKDGEGAGLVTGSNGVGGESLARTNSLPMLLRSRARSSSDPIQDSIDDALVEGDSSETVVAQQRLSMRGPAHRSVADILSAIKESSPGSSFYRDPGNALLAPLERNDSDDDDDDDAESRGESNGQRRLDRSASLDKTRSTGFDDGGTAGDDDGDIAAKAETVTQTGVARRTSSAPASSLDSLASGSPSVQSERDSEQSVTGDDVSRRSGGANGHSIVVADSAPASHSGERTNMEVHSDDEEGDSDEENSDDNDDDDDDDEDDESDDDSVVENDISVRVDG